jgi:ribonuclease HI
MEGTYRLYTDGGARGNPGPAGIGFVVVDQDDNSVIANSKYVGETTNNVAEYRALTWGLERCLEFGLLQILCWSDSLLLVKQVNGLWKVKNKKLIASLSILTKVIHRFDFFEIEWVSRDNEFIQMADALVNKALDKEAKDTK